MTLLPPRPLGVDDARLAALAAFNILDPPPERGFDDIVHLARRLCDVPALVSLVDRDRQWFKARAGFPPCETDLDRSVCKFVLAEHGVLQIPDLTADLRTLANPLVTDEPHLRFYAGAPLRTPEGHVLGSLCVIDRVPRPGGLTLAQVEDLEALARQVMDQLVLRRAIAERDTAIAEQRRFLAQRATLIETQGAVAAAEGDLDAVLSTLVSGALRAVTAADGAAIELREGDDLVYRSVAGTLAGHAGTRLPVDGSLAGTCLRSGEAILCPDMLLDPRVRSEEVAALGLRFCILLPVSKGHEVAGVLKLQSATPGAFTERDLYAALTFAGSVSAGLAQTGEAEARRVAAESERLLGLERGLLRTILQQAPVGISIAHAGGGALLNDRMVEMLGHGVGGADDARYAGYGAVHADGSPYAVTDYPTMRALRRGEIIQGEAMRYHNARDGQVREWRAHSAPVLAPGGEPMAAVSVFIDVDDHVRTLDALKQSEARYRSLIDLSPAIIWYGQPDGTLTFASHQLYDLTGLTPEELPPQEWPRVTHPRDLPAALDAWERARECGTLYEAEFRIRAATGAYRWFASRAAPVRDAEGTVVGWLGHNTDIDARKLAEAEAAKLAAIVEQSADFVGIADAEGRVEYVNAASRVLVGLADEDTARAKRVADFFSPEDLPFVEAEIVSRVVSGESWVGDFIFRDFATGGPVPVHYNLFPLRAPLGEFAGFATVSRDITGRKRDEARQELLNRELSHRMKNLFALVQAIAASTLRSASDVGEARDVLAGRLVALGKAHDVLLGGAAEHAPLTDLVRQGVGVQETEGCIDYRGPDIEIGGKAALSLTLMLHELTTNAIKYGALSAPDGRVELVAELFGSDGAPDLRIAWTERGGPPVSPPARKGFGSRLIERGITAQVGGALTMDFAPEGLRCVVEAPLAGFQAGD